MELAIASIILIIVALLLRKMSFFNRLKAGLFFMIFLFLTLGSYHLYSRITLIEEEEANAAIDEYIARCSKDNDILYLKVLKINAIEIYSQAGSKAAIEPVKNMESKLYSQYRLKTGQGDFSDVVNYLPTYVAENFLGVNFESNIEQISIKAGMKALEEAKCDDVKTSNLLEKMNPTELENNTTEFTQTQKSTSDSGASIEEKNSNTGKIPQTQNLDIETNQVIKIENTELIANASAPLEGLDPNAFSSFEEWERTQDKIKSSPENYLSECIESSVQIAQEYGGLEREDALAEGIEDSCKQQLAEIRKCMSMNNNEGHQCYMEIFEDTDI